MCVFSAPWLQIEAAAAASESALNDKATALAAADAAAAAEASKAQAQGEARWKEATEQLAALQKQMQVGVMGNVTSERSLPTALRQLCCTGCKCLYGFVRIS